MSDPRSPEDGPDWPERDLEENRAPEPGAGWSDDPDPYEPLPPSKPSVEPLEGEWSDSEPFDSEPPEPDPFAPSATPPQDDAWAFPPRSAPPYEPAPTEPPFESEPAWTDTWSQPEQPAAEQPSEGDGPVEAEPMVADEPEPEVGPEPEPEPGPEVEPEPEPEPEPERPEMAAAVIAAQSVADELAPTPPVDEPAEESVPEAERPEMAAAAIAAQSVADELAPTPPVVEAEPEMEPEPEPEPEFEAEHEPGDEIAVETAAAVTAFGGPPDSDTTDSWDPKRDGNRRSPTTAEQAVPWLIGIILALAGIVIVLLALIFSSPGGLVASDPTGTPLAERIGPTRRRRAFDRPERQRQRVAIGPGGDAAADRPGAGVRAAGDDLPGPPVRGGAHLSADP